MTHPRISPIGATLLALAAACGDPAESLRQQIGDVTPVGDWIYDDIDAGVARAAETGKPLLLTFRCVP